ncbi:hypothetical protein [Treponema denticola]|uniref:Uncharacterized protein n=1 Tax=Treponema denticola SP33 TaxID=999437 RepID=M2BCZ1_TREDN|nr:hypothetical protein [Treponema denticola]EMB22892.1 hypothetical protein HMPREF9733_01715 [Treponema denticola SP33]EPF38130.1 hypothetical protein HMPREF9732_00004 [Treponema denticola SP32]
MLIQNGEHEIAKTIGELKAILTKYDDSIPLIFYGDIGVDVCLFKACKGYHEYTDELEAAECEGRFPEFRRLIFGTVSE